MTLKSIVSIIDKVGFIEYFPYLCKTPYNQVLLKKAVNIKKILVKNISFIIMALWC